MLTIRFSRRGKRNQPHYRIIILEKSKDPWGDFKEDLGFYNPQTKESNIKKERVLYWISKGAKPSGSVHNLLVKKGVLKGEKVKVTKVHKKQKEELEKKETEKLEQKENLEKEEVKEEPGQGKKEEKPEQEEPKEAPEQEEQKEKSLK